MVLKVKVLSGIALLSMLLLAVNACTVATVETGMLEDTKWILDSFGDESNLREVINGSQVTATFESAEGQVRGSAGCNTYFGDYELNGDKIYIGNVAHTEIGCMEPEGVMDQEQEYLAILQLAERYEMDRNELKIYCDGQVLIYGFD